MGIFVKKPVRVEAIQFTGENFYELRRFCDTHRDPYDEYDISTFNPIGLYSTSEDQEVVAEVWDKLHSTWVGVKAGQWIIKGIQGEFYPCDAEVFSETYTEAVAP